MLDGYLIGWKYYYKTSDGVCTTNSHVTVFGKRGTKQKYKHKTSTLIPTVKFAESGIRVQYVQKDLIPVQRKDLLGIYTVNCGNTAKHVVSAESVSTGAKHVYKKVSVTIGGVETLSVNSFTDSLRL